MQCFDALNARPTFRKTRAFHGPAQMASNCTTALKILGSWPSSGVSDQDPSSPLEQQQLMNWNGSVLLRLHSGLDQALVHRQLRQMSRSGMELPQLAPPELKVNGSNWAAELL
jgi:hypothetical protein